MSETLTPVTEVVVVKHPNLSDPKSGERREELLHRSDLDVEVVESCKTLDDTIALLAKKAVNPGIVFESISGDGVFHWLVEAAMKLGLKNRFTTITGGGACDTGHMLHPSDLLSVPRLSPRRITRGETYEHHPLVITATHKNIPKDDPKAEVRAVSYATFGYTADVAKEFGTDKFLDLTKGLNRTKKLALQGKLGYFMIGNTGLFTIEDESGVRDLSDLTFPNGSRMAEAVHFGGLRLADERYGRVETEGQLNRHKLVGALALARVGGFKKYEYGQTQTFTITPIESDTFVMQADGEVYDYPSGTEFTVGASEQTIKLITSDASFLYPNSFAA
jgi:hypothetical protein